MIWSGNNPYFFKGKSRWRGRRPSWGLNYIWPMSIIMKVLQRMIPKKYVLVWSNFVMDGGTGFMHESFHSEDAADFTRSWFAWTNTLFGELILNTIKNIPTYYPKYHEDKILVTGYVIHFLLWESGWWCRGKLWYYTHAEWTCSNAGSVCLQGKNSGCPFRGSRDESFHYLEDALKNTSVTLKGISETGKADICLSIDNSLPDEIYTLEFLPIG